MNKKAIRAGVTCGISLETTIIVYVITLLFHLNSEASNLSKKTVFQFGLTTDRHQQKWDWVIVLT